MGHLGMNLTKTPYLVLFVLLASVGVGTASALITITLAGNVVITDDLTVDSATLVVDSTNNRVGIGTTSPERKFDVRGTITSQADPGTQSNNLQIKRPGALSSTNVAFVLSERNTNQDLWLYGYDGMDFKNFVGFDYPEGKVSFPATGNTLVIDEANANVGIGTSSPVEELEVVGNIRATPIVGQWNPESSTSVAGQDFVEFDNEKINTDTNYFGFTAGNDFIEIKKAGLYLITTQVLFEGSTGGFAIAVVWRYNSADIQQERICTIQSILAGVTISNGCSSIHSFDANDRVKLQDDSSSAGIFGPTTTNSFTFLNIQRLN